ncbi:MAG: TIGR02921 family PEP-CTERM protein [Spirulinaceae cyanobacterium]
MIKKTLPPAQPPSAAPAPPTAQNAPPPRLNPKYTHAVRRLLNIGSYGIFWLWNLCFLLLLYGFVLPTTGRQLVRAVVNGEIAAEMLLTLVGLMLVPTVCAIAGVWKLRRSPGRLVQLFFGVEAPLMMLLGLRVGLLRELTDASYFLIGTFILSIFACALGLWRSEWSPTRRWLGWLQGAVQSLMIIVGLYVAVLMALYTVPTVPGLLWEIGDYIISGDWIWSWHETLWWTVYESAIALLGSLFAFVTLAFGFVLPVIFGWLYIRVGLQGYQHLVRRQGRGMALIVVLSTLMAWFVIFGGVNRQPQLAAFAQVEAADTAEGRAALLQNEPAVRQGLLNAYLHPYRYLGTDGQKVNLKRLYSRNWGIEGDRVLPLQYLHDWLLSPFLYQGGAGDADRAATLYAEIFDEPIQKAEQDAILKAMKSTVMLDAANAGVLDIGRRKVWVARQELNVEPHGDYVDVELYEVYQNQTHEVEEIFYSFALPPNAVLTGIWLGETADLSDRFPFQVAPRGAAQRVYNSQVQRERPIDPALLEEVGPNQYRLRAFPIPEKLESWEHREGVDRPTELHLWLTYRALPQDGEWLLPSLTEARNVYWSEQTQRLRNGAAVPGFENWFEDTMQAIPEVEDLPPIAVAGYDFTAQAIELDPQPDLSDQEIALILDTSYSMGQHRAALQTQLDALQEQGLLDGDRGNGEATLYTLAAGETQPQKVQQPSQFTAQEPLFYGVVHLQDLVRSWQDLEQTNYDALILLSDEGSYELIPDEEIALAEPEGGDRTDPAPTDPAPTPEPATPTVEPAPLPTSSLPIWTVHLGFFPAAYEDDTLKAIQDSQGRVTRSVAEALQQWRQQTQLAENEVMAGAWRWKITPNPDAAPTATGLEPIAARVLIDHLAKELDANDAAALDALHAIATEQAIVTPYSSMLVLVNDEQRELLKQAEASGDRFNRTVEAGDEEIQQPTPAMGAVPEPSVWVGTLVATGFFWLQRRRRVRR